MSHPPILIQRNILLIFSAQHFYGMSILTEELHGKTSYVINVMNVGAVQERSASMHANFRQGSRSKEQQIATAAHTTCIELT